MIWTIFEASKSLFLELFPTSLIDFFFLNLCEVCFLESGSGDWWWSAKSKQEDNGEKNLGKIPEIHHHHHASSSQHFCYLCSILSRHTILHIIWSVRGINFPDLGWLEETNDGSWGPRAATHCSHSGGGSGHLNIRPHNYLIINAPILLSDP